MPNDIENPPAAETAPEVSEAPAASETPAAPSADQVAETNRVLKEVSERLGKTPSAPAPTQEQVRDLIKKKTGMTDEGIDWVMNFNREVVQNAVGPLAEKLSWGDLRSAKAQTSFPVTAEIEKEMQDELKSYPAQHRADPVLLEKVYLMSVGKQQLKTPRAPAAPNNNNPVVRRTIVSNNPQPPGRDGGTSSGSTQGQLSDEEKRVAQKMGVSEAEYGKWKGNPVIQR